jgi:hypothetical protein
MLSSLLAAGGSRSPQIDYHALAPEIVLGVGICSCCSSTCSSPRASSGSGDAVGLRAARPRVPVVTLA